MCLIRMTWKNKNNSHTPIFHNLRLKHWVNYESKYTQLVQHVQNFRSPSLSLPVFL